MVNRKNFLITGSNGQLGNSIKEISNNYHFNFFFKKKEELDITNFSIVKNFLKEFKINTIINCAAYTDVNGSEENIEVSEQTNDIAVGNIAKLCSELNIQLIHISTDYVFDGFSSVIYNEENETKPQTHYGITKLNGEKKVLKYKLKDSIIIRTSWLYSKFGSNFVKKILNKIKMQKEIFVVDNEIGSPTNASDLAKVIMEICPRISNEKTEIYHFSNLGYCSRFQFAKKINEFMGGDCKIIPTKKNSIKVKRPKFSALNSSKIIENFQIKINNWDISLKNHLMNNKVTLKYEI